jgi:hypothetical protein
VIAPKHLAHHWPSMMKVELKRVWSVSHEGSPPWLVPADQVVEVDGNSYLKLWGRTYGFVKVICHDMEKVPRNFSLCGSLGLCSLVELRNEAGRSPEERAKNIFGKIKARKSLTHAAQEEAREHPRVVEFTVPAFHGSPATVVKALKSVHPNDNLSVEMDANSLAAIFGYIRDQGLDKIPTRAYIPGSKGHGSSHDGSAGPVWNMGGKRLARKLTPDADRLDEDQPPAKFKYIKGQQKK